MTTDLMKDLEKLVTALDHEYWTANFAHVFIRTHHATIQQNAEAVLRLRALEQASGELGITLKHIRERADELLREWAKEKSDE